jgi:hypothetical protein
LNARQKAKKLKKELEELKADKTNGCKWLRIDGLRIIPPAYFYYNDKLAEPEKYQIIIGKSIFEGELFDPDILVVIDSEKLDKAIRERERQGVIP